jgi:hypothetical protein
MTFTSFIFNSTIAALFFPVVNLLAAGAWRWLDSAWRHHA